MMAEPPRDDDDFGAAADFRKQALAHVARANDRERGGFLERLFDDSNRYADAAEYYDKAAKSFKLAQMRTYIPENFCATNHTKSNNNVYTICLRQPMMRVNSSKRRPSVTPAQAIIMGWSVVTHSATLPRAFNLRTTCKRQGTVTRYTFTMQYRRVCLPMQRKQKWTSQFYASMTSCTKMLSIITRVPSCTTINAITTRRILHRATFVLPSCAAHPWTHRIM